MRILYDGTIFGLQVAGGVNRYFVSLIRRLSPEWEPMLFVPAVDNAIFPEHPRLRVFRWQRFRPTRISNVMERTYFKAIARGLRPRLLHPTYYTLLSRRQASAGQFHRRRSCPVVVNVWDMLHERYPKMTDPTGFWAARKRDAVLNADAVICISEQTRQDLLERIPVSEERVSVVYLASDIHEGLSYGDEPVPASPYFLWVGSRAEYKNFNGTLDAFARVATHHPGVILAVVGPPFKPTEERRIHDLNLKGRVQLVPVVNDRWLAKLYRRAEALVYPSLYEGFGLPPLEAMACNTVVISSNSSSLPEVVGEAALTFDPTSTEAVMTLAAHMSLVLDSPAERARLIKLGKARVARFNWGRTAEQVQAVYRQVLNG